MNSKKPRNREKRTRSIPAEATVSVHMLLPRSAYEEMRQLLSEHKLSKADILMAGIEACLNRKAG